MKLVEKLEQVQGPFYTFEFFPPRTDQVRRFVRSVITFYWLFNRV